MASRILSYLALFLQHVLFATAQYPASTLSDANLTRLRSPADPRIIVRFKTPPIGTCTTVFPTQDQYVGYVTIPPFTLAPIQQNYTINTFFWFIEARTDSSTAPLTIWMNGGPGSSSMVGLFQETGPCEVIEVAKGRLGTRPRDWGWDRSSNMLFVDQPNHVGFSYDEATNGTLNLFLNKIQSPPYENGANLPAETFPNGTFSSSIANNTANTTEIAAHAVWHMLQGFLGVFPQYNPAVHGNTTGAAGINLFAESYGGKYGPAFAALWEQKNAMGKNGSMSNNKTLDIHLQSLGIIQGCVDELVQGPSYATFANNNTFGIQALSSADQQAAASGFNAPGGCQQQLQNCRNLVQESDNENEGDVDHVNTACKDAEEECRKNLFQPVLKAGRNLYDITQRIADPFPPSYYLDYLNDAEVQAAIGVGVNYTQNTDAVGTAFRSTGDMARGDQIGQMAYLLSRGVRVALLYGDRDFICNWKGGEAVSFAVAAQSPSHNPFYSAGYADIVVNSTYVGGAVRQFGNLSFSRIYEAGHLIPAYQPETAFTVFTRIIKGNDISLGGAVDLSTYKSNGTANATYTSKPPSEADPVCWIRDMVLKCEAPQKQKIMRGFGVTINGVYYDKESDWRTPPASVSTQAGWPGHAPSAIIATGPLPSTAGASGSSSSSTIPTGVYTATSTPSPTKKGEASNSVIPTRLGIVLVLLVVCVG